MELWVARDDDIAPLWQGSADAVVGFATHNDGVSEGYGLEVSEILGYMPRHSAACAYDSVLGHCHDD